MGRGAFLLLNAFLVLNVIAVSVLRGTDSKQPKTLSPAEQVLAETIAQKEGTELLSKAAVDRDGNGLIPDIIGEGDCDSAPEESDNAVNFTKLGFVPEFKPSQKKRPSRCRVAKDPNPNDPNDSGWVKATVVPAGQLPDDVKGRLPKWIPARTVPQLPVGTGAADGEGEGGGDNAPCCICPQCGVSFHTPNDYWGHLPTCPAPTPRPCIQTQPCGTTAHFDSRPEVCMCRPGPAPSSPTGPPPDDSGNPPPAPTGNNGGGDEQPPPPAPTGTDLPPAPTGSNGGGDDVPPPPTPTGGNGGSEQPPPPSDTAATGNTPGGPGGPGGDGSQPTGGGSEMPPPSQSTAGGSEGGGGTVTGAGGTEMPPADTAGNPGEATGNGGVMLGTGAMLSIEDIEHIGELVGHQVAQQLAANENP